MLAVNRQSQMFRLLSDLGSLKTGEIAERLAVTHETIRKDFELLENRGQLVRTHGGATLPDRQKQEIPLAVRQSIRYAEKRSIAQAAAARIQPNEIIFLDASSTVHALTEFIPRMPLTILTNSPHIFTALAERTDLDLICTGGLYDPKSSSFIGLPAEQALQRYHIHRMFFSGNGIDLKRGVSEINSRQAAFKERVAENADDVVFLADHSKFGVKSSFFFVNAAALSCVVTNKLPEPVTVEFFFKNQIELVVPD